MGEVLPMPALLIRIVGGEPKVVVMAVEAVVTESVEVTSQGKKWTDGAGGRG